MGFSGGGRCDECDKHIEHYEDCVCSQCLYKAEEKIKELESRNEVLERNLDICLKETNSYKKHLGELETQLECVQAQLMAYKMSSRGFSEGLRG